MKLARWIYLIAGTYGVLVLVPGFFVEMWSPPVPSPEFYYGFFGSALVWQFVFFLIASDPARYRALMAISILEKLAFFATCVVLYALGRMTISGPFIGGMIDGILMILFIVAWRASRPPTA